MPKKFTKPLILVKNGVIMNKQSVLILKKGDLIVVTGGFPMGEARRTNYLRIIGI